MNGIGNEGFLSIFEENDETTANVLSAGCDNIPCNCNCDCVDCDFNCEECDNAEIEAVACNLSCDCVVCVYDPSE